MTKEELQAILDQLPAGTEVYVRKGDDAYPITARIFEIMGSSGSPEAYIDVDHDSSDHRNFPEHYNGCKEVTERYLSVQWLQRGKKVPS